MNVIIIMRAKKQCANINCNVRIVGKTYCDIHTDNFSTSTNTISRNPQWPKLRAMIRARDMDTCYLCGNRGTIVDHIIPQILNGSNDPSNLACICQPCHNYKTAHDGRIVKSDSSHIDKHRRMS